VQDGPHRAGPDPVLVSEAAQLTLTAGSRNTAGWQRLLQAIERANPTGDLYVVSDNLSSHDSRALRAWLVDHPRIRQVFIPKGACLLNLQEGWWRLFRRAALAGQSFAGAGELKHATRVATRQLNRRARP
jgi:transposase